MRKAFGCILGSLTILCAIVLVLLSFSVYERKLYYDKGVVGPRVEVGGTDLSVRQECLTRNRIPWEIDDGILYVSEQDFDSVISACA